MTTFCTRQFERSHGRKPSRTAAGSWAFSVDGAEPVFAPMMKTVAEAKAWVRAEFPSARFVEVLP